MKIINVQKCIECVFHQKSQDDLDCVHPSIRQLKDVYAGLKVFGFDEIEIIPKNCPLKTNRVIIKVKKI